MTKIVKPHLDGRQPKHVGLVKPRDGHAHTLRRDRDRKRLGVGESQCGGEIDWQGLVADWRHGEVQWRQLVIWLGGAGRGGWLHAVLGSDRNTKFCIARRWNLSLGERTTGNEYNCHQGAAEQVIHDPRNGYEGSRWRVELPGGLETAIKLIELGWGYIGKWIIKT